MPTLSPGLPIGYNSGAPHFAKIPGIWEACVRGRDVEQMVDQERTRMIPNRFSNQFSIFAMGNRDPGPGE